MMNITLIAGARPNFMKIAPILHELKKRQAAGAAVAYRLVHTGQHFDHKMSEIFFKQLDIPEPDVNLGAGGGSQAEQTAAIMTGFEKELKQYPADLVIVVGDVTSTMACAITAQKLQTKVAHVEAGIRSGDWSMPEEINRLVTDSITNYFFTTSEVANQHLRSSGVSDERIFFVGNTMIDTLYRHLDSLIQPEVCKQHGLQEKDFFVLTLHRPSNVDDPEKLKTLLDAITTTAAGIPVIFPVHPRTRKIMDEHCPNISGMLTTDPLSYKEFIYLVKNARAVITDSGGITEEATVLNTPCLTLRNTTERPETCTIGSNELIGDDLSKLRESIRKIRQGIWKTGGVPPLWDGQTAVRIVDVLLQLPTSL